MQTPTAAALPDGAGAQGAERSSGITGLLVAAGSQPVEGVQCGWRAAVSNLSQRGTTPPMPELAEVQEFRVYRRKGEPCHRCQTPIIWPRGLKKEAVKVEAWLKTISPSNGLRRWFEHDPAKWEEFQRRYFTDLDEKPESWQPLLEAARQGDITLVSSARETEHNNAVALRNYLDERLKGKAARQDRHRRAAAGWLPARAL